MTAIKRILCATDTSPASAPAVHKAAALAVHLGAELVVMYVFPSIDEGGELLSIFAMSREVKRLADEMQIHDEAVLETLIEAAREAGATVERHVASGDPADEIAAAAGALDVDLVMTGTHGRTGIDKFLLGSVAERIIRICPRPVMVARNPEHVPTGGYKRILVPTDFSVNARAAFDMAAALAAPECEIELLHCWNLPAGAGAGPASVVQSIIASVDEQIRARGQDEIDALVAAGATIKFKAVRSVPAQAVSERVIDGAFDLVVMGSHGRSGLSRFILGSVAESTIHYAPCSVITVPEAPGVSP